MMIEDDTPSDQDTLVFVKVSDIPAHIAGRYPHSVSVRRRSDHESVSKSALEARTWCADQWGLPMTAERWSIRTDNKIAFGFKLGDNGVWAVFADHFYFKDPEVATLFKVFWG